MYIKNNFNYLKKENNYSYRDIQNKVSISIGALYSLANNDNRDVAISTVVKLVDLFQVSIDEFVLCDIERKRKCDDSRKNINAVVKIDSGGKER